MKELQSTRFDRLAGLGERAKAALALAVGLLVAGALQADTYPKNHDLDVVHYRFEIGLEDGEQRITGRATVTVAVRSADEEELAFDLVGATSEAGMTVSAVRVDGEEASYSHAGNRLVIPLPTSPPADSRLEVEIVYGGVPADALGIGPNKHGTWSWFSDNWPNKARHWLPTVDHPYDKATSEMIVTAPSAYQVISNGLLVEEADLGDGMRRTHWRQSAPIATWLYTLGVTRFAVQHLRAFRGKPVQTWVFVEDRDAGFFDFAEPTHHVLEFFSDRIGPYSYEKLANVQSARTKGGMEAATALMYDDRSVTGERSERWRNVVIHEIAHQWFGNAVTEADWDDVWLSEGFATYLTLLFIEHAYGRDEFVVGLEASRDTIFELYGRDPGERIVHDDLDDMSRVTTRNTYQKGAWVLHMLRSMLGDETFFDGLSEYYARFRDSNATTADFRRVLEELSGEELGWFFDQWLYQPGALFVDWSSSYDESAGTLEITVRQRESEERNAAFRMPIPVVIETRGADGEPQVRRETLRMDRAEQRFEIDSARAPTRVELDPDITVLMRARDVSR